MLTLFSIPKPFTGAIATAQDNSLASWKQLAPDVQIILFGDEAGIAEAAARHGVEHVADIRRNAEGTPLLDDAFARAQALARHRFVCYVNADIIFFGDLVAALQTIRLERFLLVGRRIDLDVPEAIDFTQPGWAPALRERARRDGRLHEPTGIDFFLFPRHQLRSMPPFPVGRPLWDNWMIHHARTTRTPVIDATAGVTVVHQNHGYGHVRGGQRAVEAGVEVQRNWQLVGPDFLQLTIDDATWVLTPDGPRPARDARHLLRRLAVSPALSPRLRPSVRVARYVYRLVRRGLGG